MVVNNDFDVAVCSSFVVRPGVRRGNYPKGYSRQLQATQVDPQATRLARSQSSPNTHSEPAGFFHYAGKG